MKIYSGRYRQSQPKLLIYFIVFLSLMCFGYFAVVISYSKKSKNNTRIYDKRYSCFYCDKTCAKIPRHYKHHHKDKAEVAEAFAYHDTQNILKKALEKLQLQGNFHYTLCVLKGNSGQLIVMRRPGEEEDCCQDDYLPCIHCLGFVKTKDLWRHN